MKHVTISRATTIPCGQGTRVTALVDSEPVWFECDTTSLSAVGEVFGSAMFVPGLQQGRAIDLEDPVSPRWLGGMPRIAALLGGWWGFPQLAPLATPRTLDLEPLDQGAMLCFSSGVDAFHTLLHSGERITRLITAHGYDIRLTNVERWQHLEAAIRRAASDAGRPLSIIRSNLRQHPLYKATIWPRCHGGALATLGHLMRGHGDRLLISSSFTPDRDQPWGTHWNLDHSWSSEALRVRHFGEQSNRIHKIRAIAHEPLVRRNLHVCLKAHSDNGHGNCSRCEKCVRTMVILAQCDALDHFPVFSPRKTLPDLVDDLPGISPAIQVFWQDILVEGLPPDLTAAVERFLQRAPPVPRRHGWWSRTAKRIRASLLRR